MAQGNYTEAYKSTGVQTATQKQLVVMLYDGINSFLTQAVNEINENKLEKAHDHLTQVGKILLELLSTLREDLGGDIAANLKQLYVYSYEKIVLANLSKDIKQIEDIRLIMGNLREGWAKTSSSTADKQVGATVQNESKLPDKITLVFEKAF